MRAALEHACRTDVRSHAYACAVVLLEDCIPGIVSWLHGQHILCQELLSISMAVLNFVYLGHAASVHGFESGTAVGARVGARTSLYVIVDNRIRQYEDTHEARALPRRL